MLTTGSLNIFDLFILDAGIFWHKKVRTQIAFGLNLAEREGFEPSMSFQPIHEFQSCAINRARRPLRIPFLLYSGKGKLSRKIFLWVHIF